MVLFAAFYTACTAASAPAQQPVSVSGLSSGADAAVQLAVAYSSLFAGAGVFAGQAYHCAVQRFPNDKLVDMKASPSVPFCDGCPAGQTLTYDHCKRTPSLESNNVTLLVNYARAQAKAKTIDPLSELAKRKIYLYRGLNDTTYNKGAVQAAADVFTALMPPSSVFFEKKIRSPHLVPGIDPHLCWWEEWAGRDNCTYDGAAAALRWIHGAKALAGGRRNNSAEAIWEKYAEPFDQARFDASGGEALMTSSAMIFIPPGCAVDVNGTAAPTKPCLVHMFLHGCGVSFSYDTFAQYAGFNEWAVDNMIVVVYPKMGTSGSFKQEQSGCWDGYGQTGSNYDQKSGLQMKALAAIAVHFSGAQPLEVEESFV